MKPVFLISILFTNSFINCFSQTDAINKSSHEKYWYYRKRLLNEFVVAGEDCLFFNIKNETGISGIEWDNRERIGGCGLSVPAKCKEYKWKTADSMMVNELVYADAPGVLGWYIGVLATELKLLYIHNQPYQNTQRELYFALKAYERLDKAAEKLIYGTDGSLNGFFLRDDVDRNLTDNFKYLGDIYSSDLIKSYTETQNFENKAGDVIQNESDPNVFMTQDQLGGLFLGFALVKKCLSGIPEISSYNNFSFTDAVTSYTREIATRLCYHLWVVMFDNLRFCKYGENLILEGNAYGIAKAADYITDYKYNYAGSFAYGKPPSGWTVWPCVGLFPVFMSCIMSLNDVNQQSGWKIKGLYNGDVTNLFFPGTGDAIGKYLFDKMILESPHHDYSAGLTLEFVTIGNSWQDRDDNNITRNALSYYENIYHTEIFKLINDYLYDADSRMTNIAKYSDYLISAPVSGPHINYDNDPDIPGWLIGNKWTRPYRAYHPASDTWAPTKFTGLDYMLLYNMIWLRMNYLGEMFQIITYTYPEEYIYPLYCLNKAYFPLNVKHSQPVSLPDQYSSGLALTTTTPYQNGSYHFEAPSFVLNNNLSIEAPAQFVINSTVDPVCTDDIVSPNFNFTVYNVGCHEKEVADFNYTCYERYPYVVTDVQSLDNYVDYTWTMYDGDNVIASGSGKSIVSWWRYATCYKVETHKYYIKWTASLKNGVIIREKKVELRHNRTDDCCYSGSEPR